ncbi:hypothetical protein [Amycolatopsis sp. ATCC 39116]|uniref:hypothetical protein n=1 Tax=Amycolatopsis sp. (strain ATCC 39116 / 75iv2) TaxID=385957 RepID=UPI00026268EC|nr:hypothetical protein [Amycolatopsis sp. ATCC 39116]
MTEAERVVRTVHEALGRALDQLRREGTRTRPDAAEEERARATLKVVVDELDASVAPVMAEWAQMVLRGADADPRIAPYYPRVAFAAYLEGCRVANASFATHTSRGVEVLLAVSKKQLDVTVATLDEPPPEPVATLDEPSPAPRAQPEGRIGARPSAGPRFYEDPAEQRRQALLDGLYERALPLAQEVVAQSAAAATPEAGVPGPYDDVREPWFRRVFAPRRRRG